tara:strand:+ start:369 stop:563 length:195 start_codon:yes stop_codon:yes gene_type:complete
MFGSIDINGYDLLYILKILSSAVAAFSAAFRVRKGSDVEVPEFPSLPLGEMYLIQENISSLTVN